MRCDGAISDYFSRNTGVRQVCVLAPTLLNTCTDHVLEKMSEIRAADYCSEHSGSPRLTLADDAVKFTETTEVLPDAHQSLSEKAAQLGFRVSWIETEVRVFGDILVATIVSIPVSGENVEVTQMFT